MKKQVTILLFLGCISCFCQEKSSITDPRDGNTYTTVKIGDQFWFAENLRFKPEKGKYWGYEDVKAGNATDIFGYLYQWNTAITGCPSGWHLPSEEEWNNMINFLGGREIAGGKLKTKELWHGSNKGATNESGFSAVPGGTRMFDGKYYFVLMNGYYWTSTEIDKKQARECTLGFSTGEISIYTTEKNSALSVRCIKD